MSNIRCINFYDLCRICTASSEQKTNIYSSDGRAKNLSYKISQCLELNIDEKDRLPKVICTQCLQHVEQMYEFRNMCKNSQTMLSNCLNFRAVQSDDNGINDSSKSINILGNPQLSSALSANGLTVQPTNAQTSNDLLNSIMQAVQVQQQPVIVPQQYSITMDNSLQPATIAPQQETQNAPAKSDKPNTLEEFIRLKPDIKITPLGKKDNTTSASSSTATSVKQQPMQAQLITQQPALRTLPSLPTAQLQIQPQQFNDQLQQQQVLWQQLQQLQQQQLQQQLQQLTTQLQAQAQFAPTNTGTQILQQATDDAMGPSDSKKPKLNFVLSSPTTPQFATTLPQISAQPQLQLQLGTNMMSPNKCFLPITIRDEHSDQQIVAHIDTKNLMLPTTYQVQMKLQPQLATADGQPIMQLTPTSIPATLQLTPQTLGSAAGFQNATASASLQSQLMTAQPQQQQQQLQQNQQQQQQLQPQLTQLPLPTGQVTSQQIIRSPQPNATPQLVITSVKSECSTPTPSRTAPSPTFKTPSPPRQPTAGSATNNVINITPNTDFTKRLVAQVKQQQLQQKGKQQISTTTQTSTSSASSSNITMQRLSSNTTITKVKPQSSATKMPVISRQNITISRVTTQVSPSAAKILQASKPTASSSQSITLAAQPPTAQTVKQKPAVAATTGSTAAANKPIRKQQPEQSVTMTTRARQQQPQLLPVPTSPSTSESQAATAAPTPETAATQAALTCATCGREFKKKEHLTQHVKLHAGLRPFKCTEESCDKAFSRKEHLSRHLVSHSGQKMFTCEVCKKPFSRKDNLNKHKRIHSTQSSDNYFSCDICHRSFASKAHCDKHREMHGKSVNISLAAAATAENSTTTAKTAVAPAAAAGAPTQQLQMLSNVTQAQSQIMHVQLQPTVVTTQDLAGNTITITQAPDSNLQTSLANFVQLGFPQFQNGSAPSQIVCKIEK